MLRSLFRAVQCPARLNPSLLGTISPALSSPVNKLVIGSGGFSQSAPFLFSPFISHGSVRNSITVGRSSAFHCKARRSHRRNPSTSSPSIFAASFSRLRSGIGTRSFHSPDSSQKTQPMCFFVRNAGGGWPSKATSSAMWTPSSNIPSLTSPFMIVYGQTISQAYQNSMSCIEPILRGDLGAVCTHDHRNAPYIYRIIPVSLQDNLRGSVVVWHDITA